MDINNDNQLALANKEITVQKKEKANLTAELIIANKELIFQNEEKEKRAAELLIANEKLGVENAEKEKRAAALVIANKELAFQNEEKEKRAAELLIANEKLGVESAEKEKRAVALIIANKELVFQNEEKEKRAAELLIANEKLIVESAEKEKRAAALVIANEELIFQRKEKKKRRDELSIFTLKNVQDRKKDEEYIGRLAAIVESSDDAIISKSLDGIIKSWNKGGEEMFGYTAKEAIGKDISLIIPAKYIFEEKNMIDRIFNNIVIKDYQTIRIKKSGEIFHVAITISPVKDHSGNIVGISKIVRDITSIKKTEEDLVKANKMLLFQNKERGKKAMKLEAAIKELESFSYSVSHDLRAPLRAINGFTQIMVEDYMSQLDEEAKNILSEIIRNSNKMGELIDNLLSFSRIGKKEITMSDINIQELIDEVIAELKQEVPKRKIKITIQKLQNINGDTNMLRQVFINLISNAFKYTGKKEEAEIEIGSYKENNNIVYYVKDNGAGFDMRYYDKLFGVFQRLHSSNEFDGTGVGLAIIQKIITKHGGRVWAEGIVNEGACFYISLPTM